MESTFIHSLLGTCIMESSSAITKDSQWGFHLVKKTQICLSALKNLTRYLSQCAAGTCESAFRHSKPISNS